MKVQVDVAAVADKHAVLGGDAVLLQDIDLVEEIGNVNDAAGADEVDATLGEDAGGCRIVSDWSRGASEDDLRRM